MMCLHQKAIKATLAIGGLLALLLVSSSYAADSQRGGRSKTIASIKTHGLDCHHGLQHQERGPFAVMVFCEDALGNYLGVICYAAGRCDRFNDADQFSWDMNSRFWQDELWASDVTSYVWTADQRYLFIATNEPYGSGGLFRLDLNHRIAQQILPLSPRVTVSDPGNGYEILSVSEDGLTIRYTENSPSDDTAHAQTKTLHLKP